MTAQDEQSGETDRRAWKVLLTIIAVCFLAGLLFLVLCVWIDWQ